MDTCGPDIQTALELRIKELELEVADLTTDNKILEVDVLLKARIIKQLEGMNNDES